MADSERNVEKREHTPTTVESTAVERTRGARVFTPHTDIYEKEDALVLLADMPGVDQDSISINVERNVLTIEGHVKPEDVEGYELMYSEYVTGDFRRSFTLSNEIDTNGIEARIRNGTLRLLLPKAKEAMPKKIEVKTE